MTDATPAAPRSGRLMGVLAFVAIVWLVTASLIAVEVVALRGAEIFLAYPDTLGHYLLSDSTKASTACELAPGERIEHADTDIGPAIARAAAWTLGLRVGEDAVVRQTPEATDAMRVRADTAVQGLAESLSVPRPASFSWRQAAMAYDEFTDQVEDDPSGTAHQLAVRYSPDACRLYKLGAFWGYSGLMRPAVPGSRSLHAAVIHHYARQLDLPDQLWKPMYDRSPASGTLDSISAETRKLTEGMTEYLLTGGGRPESGDRQP